MISLVIWAKIAVFAPLFGFLGAALMVPKKIDKAAQWLTCGLMISSVFAVLMLIQGIIFNKQTETFSWFTWLAVGGLDVTWGCALDTLSVVMMGVVTSVSCLVHLYAVGYMSHDRSIPRFMAYLSLFTFMMLMLVTAPNLIQLFFGWEGVGVASYLLIGFWYERESANAAAMKAFLVNRVGDVGLALGIATLFFSLNTVDFQSIFKALTLFTSHGEVELMTARPEFMFWGYSVDLFNLAGILLFIGAMGKSAQLGLHTWLPDAMEGPTPVSALIHAATMVTAGVFLVARMSPLYELTPIAREIIVIVGALTALFAATVALTQTDIKRVIAYSTCSQLGYMFFAAGCSAYHASIFHLFTHAFFKALLFLGAGSVIHALSDEQNMEKMGGIARVIPKTCAFMWIGSLALAGIPLFAGYYSKDAVLESALLSGMNVGRIAYSIGLLVAFLTAFYSWRLLLLTFYGEHRGEKKVLDHAHESPPIMLLPLGFLAVGAILSGYLGNPFFMENIADFWNGSIALPHHAHQPLSSFQLMLPLICAGSGIGLAYGLYGVKNNPLLERLSKTVWYKISYHKWFIDELYACLFVKPTWFLGNFFWKRGDEKTLDRFGPDGVSALSLKIAAWVSRVQTGYIYHYALALLGGVVLMVTWFLMRGLHG